MKTGHYDALNAGHLQKFIFCLKKVTVRCCLNKMTGCIGVIQNT